MARSLDASGRAAGVLRVVLGAVWMVDAWLKWQPGFFYHIPGYFLVATRGQPSWLEPWFRFWVAAVRLNPAAVAWSTAVGESVLALMLVLGLLRKPAYWAGGLLSLGIWISAEGFGQPFQHGATDIGSSFIYALLFAALYQLSRSAGTAEPALDHWLSRRWRRWSAIAGWPRDTRPAHALSARSPVGAVPEPAPPSRGPAHSETR
jgi:uncharacterized membrane protein YphA (DoxX/SURF4 family)